MSCPNCGYQLGPFEQTCPKCADLGQTRQMPNPGVSPATIPHKICFNCRQPAVLTMDVCRRCGQPFPPLPATPVPFAAPFPTYDSEQGNASLEHAAQNS